MKDKFIEEERKLRRLRLLVDLARAELMQSALNIREAYAVMERTKRAALTLFPDKEEVYDLIYTSRFSRIIVDRFGFAGKDPG